MKKRRNKKKKMKKAIRKTKEAQGLLAAIIHRTEEVAEAPVEEVAFKEVVYNLTAIFNRAAFINGKWYKSGEKVDNYTVSKIGKKSVILINGSNRKILRLPKKRSIINFKGR